MPILRDVRPDKPALSEFAIGVHIGNKNPRIKPKHQLRIGSVSWQYDALWIVVLRVRSQCASIFSQHIFMCILVREHLFHILQCQPMCGE